MGQNDYKEDLEYLYAALLAHPAVISGEKKKEELEALYFAQETTVCDYDSFIDAATKLTVSLRDGHTNLEIPYTSADLCLKLECRWDGANCEKLVLKKAYEDIPEHAGIMCVEGMPVAEIVMALAERIPHENLYLVRSRMIRYPYQNYHMFSQMNLRRLFDDKGSYSVTFAVDGTETYCRSNQGGHAGN